MKVAKIVREGVVGRLGGKDRGEEMEMQIYNGNRDLEKGRSQQKRKEEEKNEGIRKGMRYTNGRKMVRGEGGGR